MTRHESKIQTASWNAVCFLVCFVLVVIQHFWEILS